MGKLKVLQRKIQRVVEGIQKKDTDWLVDINLIECILRDNDMNETSAIETLLQLLENTSNEKNIINDKEEGIISLKYKYDCLDPIVVQDIFTSCNYEVGKADTVLQSLVVNESSEVEKLSQLFVYIDEDIIREVYISNKRNYESTQKSLFDFTNTLPSSVQPSNSESSSSSSSLFLSSSSLSALDNEEIFNMLVEIFSQSLEFDEILTIWTCCTNNSSGSTTTRGDDRGNTFHLQSIVDMALLRVDHKYGSNYLSIHDSQNDLVASRDVSRLLSKEEYAIYTLDQLLERSGYSQPSIELKQVLVEVDGDVEKAYEQIVLEIISTTLGEASEDITGGTHASDKQSELTDIAAFTHVGMAKRAVVKGDQQLNDIDIKHQLQQQQPSVQQKEVLNVPYITDNSSFTREQQLRDEAEKEYHLMRHHFTLAAVLSRCANCYDKRITATRQANLHQQNMVQANAKAAICSLRWRNKHIRVEQSLDFKIEYRGIQPHVLNQSANQNGRNLCIDLHGLTIKEAVDFVQSVMNYYSTQYYPVEKNGSLRVQLVVGRGTHSENGYCRIGPAVSDLLGGLGVQYAWSPDGVIRFTI